MSVEYKDYYKVLDVSRTASQDEVAKSYKKLARKYHPDLNQDNKEAAEEKFKEINEAYEVLRDEEKRRMYDQLGSNWQHGQQFQGAPGFEQFNFNFRGGQELPIHAHDIEGEVSIAVLEGTGEFLGKDGAPLPAGPGDVPVCPIAEPHGIRAATDMRVLVTIAPPI